ncbi:MAG: DUF302 domain-containing protein [Stellaceae bacterium]
MALRHISVERLVLTSAKSFESVLAALEAAIGRPNMGDFRAAMTAAKSYGEMAQVVEAALGKSGFMEFARYDLGSILQRERGTATPKSLRLVIGNPLIMKEMVKHVPDAGSYAPVTVLIDERAGGVHLSYDKMASLLAPYGNPDALSVARDLDAKVEALLTEAAG